MLSYQSKKPTFNKFMVMNKCYSLSKISCYLTALAMFSHSNMKNKNGLHHKLFFLIHLIFSTAYPSSKTYVQLAKLCRTPLIYIIILLYFSY